MRISDYLELLDRVLSSTGGEPLEGAGKASHKQAMEKANREYQRFLAQNLSPVEEAYLQTIREAEKADLQPILVTHSDPGFCPEEGNRRRLEWKRNAESAA